MSIANWHFLGKAALFCIIVTMPINLCLAMNFYPVSPIPSHDEFEEIRKDAFDGDALSQLYLGVFYANGYIVEQDYAKAALWYHKAAEQGNATAQRNLGLLYDCGIGTESDYRKSIEFYKQSAAQLEPAAFYGLGRYILTYSESLLPSSYGSYNQLRLTALFLANPDFSAPDIEIAFWRNYFSGMKFQNEGQIVELLERRAINGDARSQLRLAIHFYQLPFNADAQRRFLEWLAKSSQHNAQAAFILSVNPRLCMDTEPYLQETVGRNQMDTWLRFTCNSGDEDWYCSYLEYVEATQNNDLVKIADLAYKGHGPALNYFYKKIHDTANDFSKSKQQAIIRINANRGDVYSMVLAAHTAFLDGDESGDFDEAMSWVSRILHGEDYRGVLQLGFFAAGKKGNFPGFSNSILQVLQSRGDDSLAQTVLGSFRLVETVMNL